jgi:hypothetical protein
MLTRIFLGKGGWVVGRGKIGRVLGEGWRIFGKIYVGGIFEAFEF